MLPGMPTVTKRPVVQPFGLASNAPDDTVSVVGRVGEHFGARYVLGHRDQNKPKFQATGETVLYNAFGQQIYLSNGKIQIGTKSSAEPLVLGNVFKTMMDTLLTQLAEHTHIGNLGYNTSPPNNAEEFVQLQESPIDDKSILSNVSFTEKGGS